MDSSRAAAHPGRRIGAGRGGEGGGRAPGLAFPGLRRRARSLVLLFGAALAALAGAPAGRLAAAPAGEIRAAGALLPRQQILHRALHADSSQHYLLCVPGDGGRGAPILVTTHGISRNVEEHAALLAPYAGKHGAVLVAPYFPEEEFGDYQRLGRAGRGRRADLALDSILAEVESLTGAPAARFYLFGFSGGAQFAHRFAMAHPDRVAGAAFGAAGWYAFPDSATAYPYGIGSAPEGGLAAVRFEPEKFLRVPMTVFVGAADTGSKNVRRNETVDRQQGTTRLERAQRWTAAMRRAAEARGLEPRVTCVTVPGIGHSFRQFMQEGALGDRVCDALFGSSRSAKPPAQAPAPAEAVR